MEAIVWAIITIIAGYIIYLQTIAEGRKKEVESYQRLLRDEQQENIRLRSLLDKERIEKK